MSIKDKPAHLTDLLSYLSEMAGVYAKTAVQIRSDISRMDADPSQRPDFACQGDWEEIKLYNLDQAAFEESKAARFSAWATALETSIRHS